MITIVRLTLIVALLFAARSALAGAPLIETSNGTVRGASDEGINTFRGIPYAAPPVGPMRWRPPQRPAAWPGVRDASRFGPICPQDLRSALPDTPQSEDCLTLNVFAPAEDPKGGLPVMVWIHGGSFRWGAGSLPAYDGIGFAQQGVVLVTLNYRLDRLGRFGHPALSRAQVGEDLANYGLMDQVAALAWVHDNIANDEQAPDKLRALSVAQILAYPQKDSSMNPVVDGRFVPEDIGRVFREGRQHAVPYLTGTNSWEGSLIRPFNLPMPAVIARLARVHPHKTLGNGI